MRLSLLMVLLVSILNLSASGISKEKAQKVAVNFLYQNCQDDFKDIDKELDLVLTQVKEEDGQATYYVFNNTLKNGFVVVSAVASAQPILAYSNESSLYNSQLSGETKYILDSYSKTLSAEAKLRIEPTEQIARAWKQLERKEKPRTSVTSSQGPLILTKWNQSPYYNDMCPTNSAGENAVVGCVAVALAQALKFYNYPDHGAKVKYHYDYSGDVTYSGSIDYRTKTFHWDKMPISLSSANSYLAEFMFLCGHSVDMDWGVDASGTYTQNCVDALKDIFSYSSSVKQKAKDDYTNSQWENFLKTELDANRPIIYAGHSSRGGHAWNCDGYMTNSTGSTLYHMNYGWGGSGNGYFLLTNLISGSTPDGGTALFDSGHRIIIGIKPPTDVYPTFCTGSRTVSGYEGLIGDGSGNQDYKKNINCKTLIKPDCGTIKTSITFNQFDLGTGDTICVYDGETEAASLIDKFHKTHSPIGNIDGSGNALLLVFTTDATEQGKGWDLSYQGKYCNYSNEYDNESVIEDGSGTCKYNLGTSCFWKIQPPGAESITLNFEEFNLDSSNKDYLRIYSETTSNMVLELKNSDVVPATFTINAPKAIIKFKSSSDEHETGDGWKISYTSSTSINEEGITYNERIKAFPNPFKEDCKIEFSGFEHQKLQLELVNLMGQKIAESTYAASVEKTTSSLKELMKTEMLSGVYILNVFSKEQKHSIKIIAE